MHCLASCLVTKVNVIVLWSKPCWLYYELGAPWHGSLLQWGINYALNLIVLALKPCWMYADFGAGVFVAAWEVIVLGLKPWWLYPELGALWGGRFFVTEWTVTVLWVKPSWLFNLVDSGYVLCNDRGSNCTFFKMLNFYWFGCFSLCCSVGSGCAFV